MKKRIRVSLYNCHITVSINDTITEGFKELNCSTDSNPEDFNAVTINFYNGSIAVLLTRKSTIGTITHECSHVVNRIFDHIGYSLDMKNDEAHAYLLEWITQKVYDICNKEVNKVKI